MTTSAPTSPAPLTPMPIDVLLGRVAHEWTTRQRIFDLVSARFWKPDPALDLGFDFLGRRAATPIGPAAGPHSQMAQNIVLAWLGGSRLFELKTVQVLDDLVINRPCIDMQTVGYNVEWSQELLVHQSLDEYVKAWMMIEILRRWEPLADHLGPDPGAHLFDMSVGYDLAGISTEKVAGFIGGMLDASGEIERLRPLIPAPFAHLRDLDFPTRVADTITLSTFHGCPPDEIESITKHLMTKHGIDVIVKLNPTLLGHERVCEILHDTLGYTEIPVPKAAFDADLQFDRGVELIGELASFAAGQGRRFGVKLTNTLVVDNHKGFMPDPTMYLSGPPLHVIATALLDRLTPHLPPGIQVSWSAGVTRENLADTLAMGVGPATICSDLLKPGGYGRLAPALKSLAEAVRADGVDDLGAFVETRAAKARASGYTGAVAVHLADILGGAGLGSYSREGNSKLPRAVDHDLEMWGCVACNFCVTVCPNDAFFRIATPDGEEIPGRQQYLLFAELCNECGNCMVFCPERGDPAILKPRLFLDPDRWAATDGQAFLLDGDSVIAKPGWEPELPRLARLLADAADGSPLGERGP